MGLMILHAVTAFSEYLESDGLAIPIYSRSVETHSRRSLDELTNYVAKQDFEFKDDIMWQINQIYLKKRLDKIKYDMLQKAAGKCPWWNFTCRRNFRF